jgi:hypothetical protein
LDDHPFNESSCRDVDVVLVAEIDHPLGLVTVEKPHTSSLELETVNVLSPVIKQVAQISICDRRVVGSSELDNSSFPWLLRQIDELDKVESLDVGSHLAVVFRLGDLFA